MTASQHADGWRLNTETTGQTVALGLFAAVGATFIATQFFSFLRTLLSVFVIPGKALRSFGPRGSWAVITGASDGIGKEYALQIAKQGYNLLLISRTASKLDTLASEIQNASAGVRVETYAMDFAANDQSDFDQVSSLVAGKDVSILINNVGQSHSIPVTFAETDPKEMDQIITINCFGTLKITKTVLPGMIERKRGLILTMGSFGGMFPIPYLATYSGSKAFLQQWSTGLAGEVASSGITVHFVHSYLVTSAMSKIRRSSALIPNPKTFVKNTLAKIGRRGGSRGYAHSGSPYWAHALMIWGIATVTSLYGSVALKVNLDSHKAIRKAALRKADREKLKAQGAKSA